MKKSNVSISIVFEEETPSDLIAKFIVAIRHKLYFSYGLSSVNLHISLEDDNTLMVDALIPETLSLDHLHDKIVTSLETLRLSAELNIVCDGEKYPHDGVRYHVKLELPRLIHGVDSYQGSCLAESCYRTVLRELENVAINGNTKSVVPAVSSDYTANVFTGLIKKGTEKDVYKKIIELLNQVCIKHKFTRNVKYDVQFDSGKNIMTEQTNTYKVLIQDNGKFFKFLKVDAVKDVSPIMRAQLKAIIDISSIEYDWRSGFFIDGKVGLYEFTVNDKGFITDFRKSSDVSFVTECLKLGE